MPGSGAFLSSSLRELSHHAERDAGLSVRREHAAGRLAGSRMSDIAFEDRRLGSTRPNVATAGGRYAGHANIMTSAAEETSGEPISCGRRMFHAANNDGRRDTHEPPGLGTVDWDAWIDSLDLIGYEGPIVLECIRRLREQPELITPEVYRSVEEDLSGL